MMFVTHFTWEKNGKKSHLLVSLTQFANANILDRNLVTGRTTWFNWLILSIICKHSFVICLKYWFFKLLISLSKIGRDLNYEDVTVIETENPLKK